MKRVIQVGTGGFGEWWCRKFLPPNVDSGHIEVVAAVDVAPETHVNAIEGLGLPADKVYTDIEKAFSDNEADFCTIVVPPALHESIVDVALAHGLNILSEKPIADTMEGSLRIAEKVKRAGVKMGVTMSHRFDQDKTTLRGQLRNGGVGGIDYVVMRFTCDARKYPAWGAFRHEIPDTLMVEGAVHHLDLLADMAGSKVYTLYASTWTPSWGEYRGDCQGLVTMTCENGTRLTYEGAKTNAVGLNSWGDEYVRAECENATLIMDCRAIERFDHDREQEWVKTREGKGVGIPLIEQNKWSNAWLIEKYVNWLEGGERMETNVEDNLQSVALIFAAIESSRTGMPVKVQEFLERKRAEIQLN